METRWGDTCPHCRDQITYNMDSCHRMVAGELKMCHRACQGNDSPEASRENR